MLSELVLRARHAIYRTFAEGGVPRAAALSAQLNIPLDDVERSCLVGRIGDSDWRDHPGRESVAAGAALVRRPVAARVETAAAGSVPAIDHRRRFEGKILVARGLS